LEGKVEQHINTATILFQNLKEEILLEPPSDGGWSIAQCLEQLNGYGRYYLPEIENRLRKQIGYNTASKVKSTWFGRYFTKIMDPKTGTRKFKAFEAHLPPADLEGHAVVAEFIQQQEAILSYIEEARKKDLNKIYTPYLF
jgi:hypothetical protein